MRLSGHALGSPERPKECALYIYKYCLYKQVGKTTTKMDTGMKGSLCRNGDTVMLEFDFQTRTCSVLYNGEEIGTLSDSLPDQLYLVANPYSTVTLRTTRFEAITFSV